MKNPAKKLALLSIVIVISFSFIDFLNAQVRNENIARPKPSNYEYLVGKKIGLSLKGDACSVLVGTIQEINGSRVTFLIGEKLVDKKFDKDTIELNYTKPRSNIFYSNDKWLELSVDFKKGNELIVFYYKNNIEEKKYPFITSDQKLFPNIRKAVEHYNNYRQNPEILLEVPNLVKNSNDMVFLGYIVEFLASGGALNYPDYTALVLSQLMESDKIPENEIGFTSMSLTGFIAERKFLPITSETRDKIIRIMINLAGSDKKLAGQAIIVLARAVNRGAEDLQSYLHPQNKIQIYENLQTIPTRGFSQKEREKFERLLIGR